MTRVRGRASRASRQLRACVLARWWSLVQVSGMGGEWEGTSFSVLRRYRDFDWLRDQLRDRFASRGVVVPPLPGKVLKGPFSDHLADTFTETRRLFLERFLQRCAEHEELRGAASLRDFLTQAPDRFGTTKEASRGDTADQLRRAGAAASSFFASAGKVLRSAVDRARGVESSSGSGTKSAEDLSFDGLEAFLRRLQLGSASAHRTALELLARRRVRALALAEMGVATRAFGRVEREGLGAALDRAGHAWIVEARGERRVAEGHVQWVIQELQDMERVAGAALEALSARVTAADRRVAALQVLEARRTHLSTLRGVQGKEAEAGEAERLLHAAEHDVELEQRSEAEVSRTVVDELERLRHLRYHDAQCVLLELAIAEKLRADSAAEAWGSAITELEEKVVEETGRTERWAAEDPASVAHDSAKAVAAAKQ